MFQNERVEYDAVQYFSDAGLGSADDVVMTDDQQKLIKVRLKLGCHEGGDGIAQRSRSRFPPSCPGFESSDCWKKLTHLSLRTCRSKFVRCSER